MELQLQCNGIDDSRVGVANECVTSTKPSAMVFGGHSAQGMLYAKELASTRSTSAITTVSKRGCPGAPGPAATFLEAMSQQCTHFMAACDVSDATALECLTDWAPPVPMADMPELDEGEDLVARMRSEMHNMSGARLKNSLQVLEDLKTNLIYQQREVKSRMQHKVFGQEKWLREQQLELEEREASIMELMADITTKLNA